MSEGRPRRKALLVEDEVLVALIAEDYLDAIGFDTVAVDCGRDALQSLAAGGFGLAVIDIGLPDGRGDDLVAAARELSPGLPIVLASGYDAADLEARFSAEPALAVLAKPYTEKQLREAVSRVVAGPVVRSS